MFIHCPNCGKTFDHNFYSQGGYGSDFRCCTRVCYLRFNYRRACDITEKRPNKDVEDQIVENDRLKLIDEGYAPDQLERAGHERSNKRSD